MAATTDVQTKTDLLAQIDALFLDNHDGAVTPEDAREHLLDVIASTMGCYGGITLDAGTGNLQASVAVAAGFVKIANVGVTMPASNVTVNTTNGELTIGAGGGGDYEISVTATYRRFEVTGGSTGFIAAGSPFEGTIPLAFQQIRVGASTNVATTAQQLIAQNNVFQVTTRAIRTLAAGDVLSVWFGTLATLLEAKLIYFHFQCKRIG